MKDNKNKDLNKEISNQNNMNVSTPIKEFRAVSEIQADSTIKTKKYILSTENKKN